MDENLIYQSTEKEIREHLASRYLLNGETINIIDIIEEAIFCLAVNTILSKRRFQEKSLGLFTDMPQNSIYIMLDAMNKALIKGFPNDYTNIDFEMICSRYSTLMDAPDVIDKINDHYNKLYGFEGGNVL